MVEFTEEELHFLKSEFGLELEVLPHLTRNQWVALQEKCFDIEVDEVMDADEGDSPVARRGMIAVRLVDYIHTDIIPLFKK